MQCRQERGAGAHSRSTSSAGSRRTRSSEVPRFRCGHLERFGIGEPSQSAVGEQTLVDGSKPALEDGVDRRAERHRFAIHRASGRDHDVGVGDQGLSVDRALGHHQAGGPEQLGPLLRRAGQHDDLGVEVAQAAQDPREQVVLEAVVQRHGRRRSHDRQRPVPIEAQFGEHGVVRLEIGQVVLLLQARVATELGGRRTVAAQPLRRDRLGHHDRAGEAAVDGVLHRGPLVVERGGRGNPQQRGGHRDVIGAVADRQVERPSASPARERGRARHEPDGLGRHPPTAMVAARQSHRSRNARKARASARTRAPSHPPRGRARGGRRSPVA